MSKAEPETETNHAMLVIWGQFAQVLGLSRAWPKSPCTRKRVVTTRTRKFWNSSWAC